MLLVLTILIGYTDGCLDPLVGSTIGFLLLGLVLLCVFINTLLFLYATGRFVYLKIRQILLAKKAKPENVQEFSEIAKESPQKNIHKYFNAFSESKEFALSQNVERAVVGKKGGKKNNRRKHLKTKMQLQR